MDYIQDAVQSQDPDLAVRDVFKRWAINEQNAQNIERKFGAEIGSNNFRSLAKGKPDEGILNKIFQDTETVKAVKGILPPEEFKKLLADHLAIMKNNFTDNGVFSSNKFNTKFRSNQYALNQAFLEDPTALDNIKHTITGLRLFPDAIPQNPSGTVKTLLQTLGGSDSLMKAAKNLLEFGKDKMADQTLKAEINAKLAGTADSAKRMSAVQGLIEKVNKRIDEGVSDALKNGIRGGAIGGSVGLTKDKFDNLKKKLGQYTSNPQSMGDETADNTNIFITQLQI